MDGASQAQQKHPAEGKGAKAVKSDFTSSLRFHNNSTQTVKLYWLDYEGKRVLMAQLQAGDSYEIAKAQLNHPYLITDEKDNAQGLYFADAQARTVVLGPPLPVAPPKGGGGGFGTPKNVSVTPSILKGLQYSLIQEELKLDRDQLAKVAELVKQDADARADLKKANLTAAESSKKLADLVSGSDKAAAAFLTPAQNARIAQIKRQQLGAKLFDDAALVQALKLSAEQQGRFTALRADYAAQTKGAGETTPAPKGFTMDPSAAFDFIAKGKDTIVINDFRTKDLMLQFAQEKGITNGELTRAQYVEYSEWQRLKTAGMEPKHLVKTRADTYEKAQALLDAAQKKTWQELVGPACKNYIPLSAFHLHETVASKAKGGFGGGPAGPGTFQFNDWTCSTTRFLNEKSVQEELKLTEAQLARLPDALKSKAGAIPADLLTPAQLQRSRGIYLQQAMTAYGPAGAFRFREVLELLALTPEQKAQILTIGSDDAVAMAAFGAPLDVQRVRDLDKATQGKIDAVLNGEQKSKLRDLLGAPFKGAINSPYRAGPGFSAVRSSDVISAPPAKRD